MIRVLIADDHELVREGLSRVLKRAGGIEVVAVADDAAGAIAAVREHPVDAIIMDLNCPGAAVSTRSPRCRQSGPGCRC